MDGECSDNQPDGDDILHDGESGDDLSFFVSGEEQAVVAIRQVGDFPPGSPQADRIGRPGRAWELAEQMRTGKWQGVFK